MKQNKRLMICAAGLILIFCILVSDAQTIYADTSYDTYSYNFWGDDVLQPPTYLPGDTIDSTVMGTTLSYPKDMFLYEGCLYIADTGNSRIVCLSEAGELLWELASFDHNGVADTLNQPQGISVTEEGSIYIADSGNGRIVEFDGERNFVREIVRPVTELISDTTEFIPTKVVSDKAGRIYCIAYGINMGLVEFDKYGEFQGFIGATEVSVSAFEYIWKNYFSTDAQQDRMETIIPTEYSNITLDSENFIFATISNLDMDDYINGADALRRLNPTGTDILRRLGNYSIIGDLYQTENNTTEGFSKFIDVCPTDYGCYFVLDSVDGKVFAYDYDGNSLFIFGSSGNRVGNAQEAAAIAASEGEEHIYILDSNLNSVLVYDITEYGQHLLSAYEKSNSGDSTGAYEEWQQVLNYNANSEFAYVGIGKTYLKEGEYKKAMDYFKLGNSRKYYTRAFKFYRKELMQENFALIMSCVGILIGVGIIFTIYKKIKRLVGEARCDISKH